MNLFQKAIFWMLQKAAGFPIWTGSTTGSPQGGWRSFDPYGASYGGLLDVPAFRGCNRVLGQMIGSVPWNVFVEDAQGKRTKALDHPAYPILHDTPNSYMTSMELRQSMMLDYCVTGNGYAQVLRNSTGRLIGLIPLPAWRTYPKIEKGTLYYQYSDANGQREELSPSEVAHVKNPMSDGICGMPHVPNILLQRALDTQMYGASFMRNQGRPSGVLSSDQGRPANDDAAKKHRQDWDEVFANPQNAGKTAVLWRGLKYEAISSTPDEAQYNETMKQLTAEFAGIFGVPISEIYEMERTDTFASAEQKAIQFVKNTARPLAVLFEQAFNKKLFAKEPGVFCELDLDGLLRGDSQSQSTMFASYAQNGIMKRNEIRRKLNLPEEAGADELTVQSNLVDLSQLMTLLTAKNPPKPQPTGAAQ